MNYPRIEFNYDKVKKKTEELKRLSQMYLDGMVTYGVILNRLKTFKIIYIKKEISTEKNG